MKILVAGGAGFIGSHVVDSYIKNGHRVWVVDDESTGRRSNVNKKALYRRLDIRDRKRLLGIFNKTKFDVINHHAAQIDLRYSVTDPQFDATVNILGTLNLLEGAALCRAQKFIFSASGGTAYGDCRRPAKEGDPENPLSPYGVAKLAAEKYISAFSSMYGLKFTIFRYANVFGPRQDPHGEAGVVAIFADKILSNERPFIFGTGNQTRDFVFVSDVAQANVLALRAGHNQIINIGTAQETSVNDLWKEMASISRCHLKPIYKPGRRGELNRSFLNINRAGKLLGWSPHYSLRRGLEETWLYFKNTHPDRRKS